MEIQEILSHLERNRGFCPEEAIREAAAHRDEIVPALLGVLEDVIRDPKPYASDQKRFIHIYAIYLLAQFREPRAYPLLVSICSLPGDLLEDLFGDVITGSLGKILASVSDGDISGMASLIENEQADDYVREAAMEGLLALVAGGKRSRDEVMEYFRGLFHKLHRTPSFAWDGLVISCADLCPEETMEDIRQAYADDLVDPFCVGLEEIEEDLAAGKQAAMQKLVRRHGMIDDTIKEMKRWSCFREDEEPDEDAVELDDPDDNLRDVTDYLGEPVRESPSSFWPEPIHRAQPKVGRNERCPCGSGKKFKKCCGG